MDVNISSTINIDKSINKSNNNISSNNVIESNVNSPTKLDDDDPIKNAKYFYARAKRLYYNNKFTKSSSQLERILRDISRASKYKPNEIKHYLLLAKVYKKCLDFNAMMSCLLYILKLNPSSMVIKNMLVDLYLKKAQELMTLAAKKDLSVVSSEYYWSRAKIYLEEGIKLDYTELKLWLYHTICCIYLKLFDTAFESVNRYISVYNNIKTINVEILILKAKLYWALGLVDMGNKEMRDINKLKSRHVELLAFTARSFHSGEKFYKEAIRYFHNKNYELALIEIKKAIAITSEDIKLYILCSKICRYLNNLEDAFNYIELAKNLYLQNQDASVTVTSTTVTKVDNEIENKINTTNEENIHFQMKVPDEIVKQSNLIYNDVALKFVSEGDYQRALVLFNKIIKSEIELTATILSDSNSSLTTPMNQQTEISNAVMTDEIKDIVAPIDYNYYINRGDCYRALNMYEYALFDYEKALKLNPKNWNLKTKISLIYYYLTINYFNMQKFIIANDLISKAISFNNKISEYYHLRGRIRYYLNDYHGTVEDYKKCIELDPEHSHEIQMKLDQFHIDISNDNKMSSKSSKFTNKLREVVSKHKPIIKDDDAYHIPPYIKQLMKKYDIYKKQHTTNQNEKFISYFTNENKYHVTNHIYRTNKPMMNKIKTFKSKVDKLFNQSLDTSKGTLWPLLNTAKDLAKDNVKSIEEIMELQGLSSTTSLPVSSVGLKMMSRSSMGKGIVEGVFSRYHKKSMKIKISKKYKQYYNIIHKSTIRSRKYKKTRDNNSSVDNSDVVSMSTQSISSERSSKRNYFDNEGDYSSGDDDDDENGNEDENDYDDSTLNQSNNDNTTNNTTRKSISINTSNTLSNDDMTDYDGNEKDQIDIDELYNHAGESKLVELLNKVGMNSDWQQFNANEGEDSLLLVSEEEEIRQEYHKAEIELENKLIAEKIRKQTMIKQEAMFVNNLLNETAKRKTNISKYINN